MKILKSAYWVLPVIFSSLLTACGSSDSNSTSSFTISGTVTGLPAGKTVALKNNGTDSLAVNSNATFTFKTAIPANGNYNVTQDPGTPTCTIFNGSGTATANVTNLEVICGITVLYSWDNTNGANPQTSLLSIGDGSLYGTTSAGGTNNMGTIFKINPTNGANTSL